jgi:integrase/recombinase XerC
MSAHDDRHFIDEYLAALITQRQLSQHTTSAYRRDLEELMQLAAGLPDRPVLASLSHFQIRKFAAAMHARDLHPRSIARKLSSWRGFYDWLADHAPLAANPVAGVKAPKSAKPLPKALSADAAVQVVSQTQPECDPDSPTQRCNRAMFELLYSSGLRVSELVALDLRHVRQGDYVSAGGSMPKPPKSPSPAKAPSCAQCR